MFGSALHIGHLLLPVGAVAAALGIVAALLLSQLTAHKAGVDPEALWSAGVFAVIAAFVCSRLLLIATDLRSFQQAPLLMLALPSLTVTGVLLSGIATAFFLYLRRISLRRALDAWAAPGALLWCALAVGDLLTGTDPGLPTHLRWGLRFSPSGPLEQPVALFAAAWAMTLLLLTLRLVGRPPFAAPGSLAALALVLGGLGQFALSFLREPLLAIYTPTPLVEPLQWLSLIAVIAGALLFLLGRNGPAGAPSSPVHRPPSGVQSHAL